MSVRMAYSSPSFTRPIATPATEAFSGTPASIKLSEPPQTVAIDDEPFDSRMSETTRIAYGQSVFVGQHCEQRALGQCAVADLAASRATQEGHFAHRERREVVVQHEALLGFAFEGLQPLHVFAGAQRGGDQRLGFAAGKDRRPVRARQHADFDPDIADLVELAAIRTALVLDHLLAEDLLAQQVEVLARLLAARFVFFGDGLL